MGTQHVTYKECECSILLSSSSSSSLPINIRILTKVLNNFKSNKHILLKKKILNSLYKEIYSFFKKKTQTKNNSLSKKTLMSTKQKKSIY
jgi:hypothetical protein